MLTDGIRSPRRRRASAWTPGPRALRTGNVQRCRTLTLPDANRATRRPNRTHWADLAEGDNRRAEDGRSRAGSREPGNTDPIVKKHDFYRARDAAQEPQPADPGVLVDHTGQDPVGLEQGERTSGA